MSMKIEIKEINKSKVNSEFMLYINHKATRLKQAITAHFFEKVIKIVMGNPLMTILVV